MTQQPLAIVDTSAIVLLLSSPSDEDDTTRARRECTEHTFARLTKEGARFGIPTPVVAELARTGPGSAVALKVIAALKRRARFEELDLESADVAGAMRILKLRERTPGQERGAISYDALIAGIAHQRGARWLLTANPRDFAALLSTVKSNVELVVTDQPPAKGQLSLVHAKKHT